MDFERAALKCLFAIGIAAVIAGAGCLINVGVSSGRIDYCRVEYDNDSSVHLPVYRIIGHRPWRPEVNVAVSPTADDAAAKIKALCPN